MPRRPPGKNSFPDASLQAETVAFFRIEREDAKFVFNEKEEHPVHDGDAVVVPVGTYHNVVNTSKTGDVEAIYDLLSAETPGRDGEQRPKPRRKLRRSWNTLKTHGRLCQSSACRR